MARTPPLALLLLLLCAACAALLGSVESASSTSGQTLRAGRHGALQRLMAASADSSTDTAAAVDNPPVRLLVVRVGILDRSGKSAFANQCDEATLKSILWGGRFNIAGQLLDSSYNKFVLTNHSAAKSPSRVVSLQTTLRQTSFPSSPGSDTWPLISKWNVTIVAALNASVPDYNQFNMMYAVLLEAMGGYREEASVLALDEYEVLNPHPALTVTRLLVRPGNATHAAALVQRAVNLAVWYDFFNSGDSDLSTPTSNYYGSRNASWTRFSTGERFVKGWIPARNIKGAPRDAAGWRALSATGLTLKSSSLTTLGANDIVGFLIPLNLAEGCIACKTALFVSFRTRPSVQGAYDSNLPPGWFDKVFIHSEEVDVPGRWMLDTVLPPGQSFSTSGLTLRFASIDKATSIAKVSLCAPAPVRVTTSKPAKQANGTYPLLVLRGGACSAGKTFKAALTLLVANPAVGCPPLYVPAVTVGHHDDAYSPEDDIRSIPGIQFTNGYEGNTLRAGSSGTQVFDIVVDPGTAPTTAPLVYTLFDMYSVVDMSAPFESGVTLVYTCTP